jgi:pimeloyl-ACP methyl ester carboxylesterase
MPNGSEGTEVDVQGVRTSVLTRGPSGQDEAVVFVHGSSGRGSDWEPFLEQVAGFTRCIAPDMPGYGDTEKPADFDYTVDGYARHLGALLDVLGVRRVQLVAHDLSGPWGLAWAASRPASLVSLTLISIGALPGYRWHRYARLYRIPVLGELVLAAATRPAVGRVLRRGGRRPVPDRFVDEVAGAYRDPGTRRAVLAFYRATPDLGAVTLRAAAALQAADPPTLVVWGRGDPYVPVRYAELQRRFFPRAEVLVLPDSGHWPLVDSAQDVAKAVVPFLRAHATGL